MKRARTIRRLTAVCGIILLGMLSGINGFSQNPANAARPIKGKVVSKTGAPVSGASISVKGTRNLVTADANGEFTILAANGETIEISSIGYAPKDIKITAGIQNAEISLEEDYGHLQDVVVVGYGKMKKTDLTSAQVTVTADDIAKTVNTTFDQALQGRAANVYVSSPSGQPGAAPNVIIRGVSSLTGSTQPLYVIDGVQIKPDNPADDPYNHPSGFANLLSGINPDDIETMNVLQGPSATAIFGAVGANGVIMITTKRGRAGETKINVSGLWTLQDKPSYIPVMNLPQYAAYRNEMAKAGGTASDPSFADPTVLGQGTNWQDALYNRTWLQKYQMSMSGGTDKTNFYLSGEYFNQQGIAPGSGFSRGSVRLNLDNQTRSWLKVGTSLSVNQTQEKVNTTNAGIIQLAIQQNPSVPVKNPDGSWGGPNTTQFQFSNPVAIANIYNDYNKSMAFIGGGYADITFMRGLVFHNEVNGSYQYYNRYMFHPGYDFNGYIVPNTSATSTRSANNNYWWNFNTRLQYDTRIGKHAITAMIAHEAQSWQNEGLTGTRTSYVTYDNQELSGGDASSISNVSNNSSRSDGAKESYFGRLNYSFNDRYYIQGIYRYDGSSNFGANKRWGGFPSVSAAWRISQENFMKTMTAVNELKLRLEYGVSGNSNAVGYYSQLQTVPTGWGTGFLSQNFANPNMQWETDKTYNIGFDLSMFNNRLQVIADFYQKNIENLLTTNPYAFYNGGDIAYSAGYISWPTTNVGSMQNKGFGVTVNTVNITNNNFVWKSSLNFSLDRNKITQLNTPINFSYSGTQAEFISEVGQPASMITGYIADGLFTNADDIQNHAVQTSNGLITVSPQGTWPGDVKFRDITGPNGKPDGVIDHSDRVIIGNPWPKYTFGFNNNLTYKQFDLNIFIIGSIGNDVLNYTRYLNELGSGTYGNYLQSVANFARPSSYDIADAATVTLTNPGYRIPRIAPGDPNGNNRISQWYIEDGSYVRIKNISLGYNFPRQWVSKAALKGLRIAVNVQNLVTFTHYKGYDPEISMVNYGGTIMAGIDTGRYPDVRMYSFNLVADF
ncbi:MAG TPA: TonB-dependent receptor [Puia sp.]|nr:TonB-dependent receptor [Puia sp.]